MVSRLKVCNIFLPRQSNCRESRMIIAKRIAVALVLFLVAAPHAAAQPTKGKEHRFLYVVEPGIRDLTEYGGAGIIVFDMDNDHKFVKRIKTPASEVAKPANIKGVCASA